MPRPFAKGNPGGPGGARPGSGRKANWFKELCEAELNKNKGEAVRLIGKIARGEAEFDKVFCSEGRVIKAPVAPAAGEIVAAAEFLRDSSFGKPTQAVEFTGDTVVNLIDAIKAARSQRGLKE